MRIDLEVFMKRLILIGFVLGMSIILTGCSYGYNFFIANVSNNILEVELKWKENLYSSPYKFKFENFDGKSFEKLESADGFTKEEIESAEAKKSLKISLEPKQALRIHLIHNKEIDENKADESFRFKHLSLKGGNGNIQLTDDQIWFQFRKIKTDYVILYK